MTFSIPLFGESKPKVSNTDFPSVPNLSLKVIGIHERKIRHPVRNHIDLSRWNGIHVAQQLRRQFAHHHQPIRKLRNLFEHDALIRVRLAQDCMKRRH